MKSNLIKLKFIFPEEIKNIKNKQELADFIMEKLEKRDIVKYAGYSNKKDLKKNLLRDFKKESVSKYKKPSKKKEKEIKNNITETIKKLNNILSHPDPPIFIFIYPWFPPREKCSLFNGVMASASFYTIHLFIDLNNYTKHSIKETLAHEWNHLVFYKYHSKNQYTLLEHIIIEGLAEVFKEETIREDPTPWALALTEEEAQEKFNLLKGKLNQKNRNLYEEVFFGSKEYKKWTGYSVGYWLIKNFRENHSQYSWEEIIKIEAEEIIKK